ncbi:nesprin-2 isoform X2 [Hemicordylus capensis]|uniref:nesprin-2 isoform X2 n=1 Tax=Hemicordylus capensis TaxID=884348 RepID=UPI0023025E00|nr:nesprin-2 isoform X2 [Hemicordylus capensis]
MASPSPAMEEQATTAIDDLHFSLQAEQKDTQKRTFTSWINSQLEKHSPPSVVSDLYTDIREGHVLLDLLEVLSGQQLPREKGSNTFQCRTNIEKALIFLKNRSIKLINIHVTDIIDGKPSIVLGLIWTIILHFHIEELAQTLACGYNHPPADTSSPTASPPPKRSATAKERWKMSAKKALLLWAKEQCATHGYINIADFKSSWRNGLAFLALIHALKPDLVDMESAKGRSNKENLKEAFQIAEKELHIPRLLEPEDVDVISPDEKSIMTYVAQFLQYFRSLPVAEEEMQGKVRETLSWLNSQEENLKKLWTQTEITPFDNKFHDMLSFMEKFDKEKKPFLPILASKRKDVEQSEDYPRMREAWDNLTSQMNEWKAKLNHLLPPPLDTVEVWLQEIEQQLAEDLPDFQDHCKVMAALEEKRRSIQSLMESFERHLQALQSFESRDKAGKLLVPPQKLEEMRRRFGNIQLMDFNILVENYNSLCSAILEELILKLNIWHIKFGTKETVELLQSDWHDFIEEKGFLAQLETALQVCEEKNKIISASNLGVDPRDANKVFKMVESKISRCTEYISNVNTTLQKVLSSWDFYTENIHLLKVWLEEMRKEHAKKVPAETMAAWNSRHGSLNEAGNFLIESSNEEVGSAVSGELKTLNRKWAKLIKKTQFEMRLLGMQEEEMKLATDSNENAASPTKAAPDPLSHSMDTSEEVLKPLPVSLGASLPVHKESLSEQEVRLSFEDAHKEMEASVLKAMQLLGQKTSPEGPVSKYEEAFSILDSNILGKFLKVAEQMKDISLAHEKAVVEEKSKDIRERWEAVRHEIVSYIQLRMDVERGKLNKVFSKLNKQINKERKLLNAGKTKGLLEEHEAIFSQQGSLGELNTCLQVMKTMSEKMTEEEQQPKTKTPVAEYKEKKEELQTRASAIHRELISRAADGHSSKRGGLPLASANGEKESSLNLCDNIPTPKGPRDEPEMKYRNGGHCAGKIGRDGDLPINKLKHSYHTAKQNLKLHLHSIGEIVASGFTDDVKDVSCFQNKLRELEDLGNKSDASWKRFESTALKLEKLADQTEKPGVSETSREELLKEWNKLQSALNARMESLNTALAIVLPIENKWVQLRDSDEHLRNREIPQCVLTNTECAFQKLKKMQASIASCIEQCNQLEQGRLAREKVDPIDQRAADVMIGKYKVRLEELGCKMQVIKTLLQDLETFLVSLRHLQHSEISSGDGSAPSSLTQQSMERAALQEVSLLKEEAKSLDERLKRVDICLKDAECGPKMGCEKLIEVVQGKKNPARRSVEEQKVIESREAQEEFARESSELLKTIQDIQDKISKIGLRDPTIPAVQQRLKLLSELRQKLDRLTPEMRSLKETANQLLQLTEDKGEEINQQCRVAEGLWKEAKLSIAEKHEHCDRVIELLKQYHSCKSCLASIIQKQEQALSQQASYMGKENLQRIIENVNLVKTEFNDHSEDVDRINQICKNLQFQLNKMKSFEEPPFENEANAIVDRWLDINERTENYCDNLGRALALWEKLLNLHSSIDGWLSTELKKIEDHHLTEDALAELEVGLHFQEKDIEEFDKKVDEIQSLLHGCEPPLELQVIKSSLSNKMDLIKKHLPNKLIPAELNGNTVELKGDLDLAKTQIGMTESLLKALSPSDTLEIFTKLEEIHQKILQQKRHVMLLQKETGCLNPEVVELKKQLKSVIDLFNSKKQIFQDRFTTLLNHQCKDFNDWFSSARLSLKECFEPSETKEELEEKFQQLMSFLTFEGKGNDIHEVKALLSKVKIYLPKVTVSQLSTWVKDQEMELQRVISKCQVRERELQASLKQFARLEEDFSSLEEWLRLQEEKSQKSHMKKAERGHFYQVLLKQRESFDSLAWLADSLRKSGFSSDEVAQETSQLASRYKALLSHTRKRLGDSQVCSAEEKNFEELAQSMFSWVQRLKESVLALSSEEPKTQLEERLRQIKEVVLLKDEGDAKLQNIAALGEHLRRDDGSKNLALQQMVSDIRNQWECTINLATDYLRHQEQLQLQKEQDRRREDDIRAALCELGKQTQEFGLDLQPGSQELHSQLADDAALLQEAENLTFLLNDLESQHNSLGEVTDSSSAKKSLMALQHLHESLLSHLQNAAELLEGHAEEEQRCKELMMCLRGTLKGLSELPDMEQKQVQQNPLCQTEGTLQEIKALVQSIKQKTTPLECKFMKDEADMPPLKHKKHLKTKLGHAKKGAGGIQSNVLKQNRRLLDEMLTQAEEGEMPEMGKMVISDIPFSAEEMNIIDRLEGCQEGRSEKSSRMKIQKRNRKAPQHFQEGQTIEEQLPTSMLAEEGPVSLAEGLKGSLMEGHPFLSSASWSGKQLQKSGQTLAVDNPLEELWQQQPGYQKKLQATDRTLDGPQTTLPLINGKVMGTDLAPSSVTHPSLESQGSQNEIVPPRDHLQPEGIAEYGELQQKVNEVKVRAAELDIVLVNDQLGEIENLCSQLEKQRAKAVSLGQRECSAAEEINKPDLAGLQSWDRMLQDLRAVKEVKQDQVHLVNNYQDCLSAVQSSMKHLSAEKENIKIRGPMEDTVLLENIDKCLASIQKERGLLSKLKTEQDSLSRYLTSMDKELTQSQVKQVEQWWEQMEDSLQRKRLRVAAKANEFKRLMDKAQELQRLLEKQSNLQRGLGAPLGEGQAHPVLLATQLQTLKHRISLFKKDAEMRMKRIWNDMEQRALESAVTDLQAQVEELEQLTPQEGVWVIGRHPQAYKLTKRTEEALLWVRVLVLRLDEKPALFPEDVASQIENCQAVISATEEKRPELIRLADEAQSLASQLESSEASALSSLSQELQTSYQDLVLKVAQRLQLLESHLRKRQKLFADMEKTEMQLQNVEQISSPDSSEASLRSEANRWQALLEKVATEIQETESLIHANYKGSPQGLIIFEQLFLNDVLRSLRNKAKRAYRLIQIKNSAVQNKIDACTKLSEQIMALQQDISSLQCDELDPEELLGTDQEVKGKLSVLKEKALAIQSSLTSLYKYKEVWECLDLKWDAPCFDILQSQFYKMKNDLEQRVKCYDNFAAEYDRHQKALGEIEVIVANIQKDCDALNDVPSSTPESSLISVKMLSLRVQHAKCLIKYALSLLRKTEVLGASIKEAKLGQIKSMGVQINGLAKMIQNKILTLQEKCRHEPGFQSRLDPNLQTLKQIQSELWQPLQVDLETHTLYYENMYCKALEDAVEAEAYAAEDMVDKERGAREGKAALPSNLEKDLDSLRNLKIQLKADIVTRRIALEEDYKTVKIYNEAVQKATDHLCQQEALLSAPPLSLGDLEESCLLSHQKQEEFEAAKAEVEALTSKLENRIKPSAKPQLGKTLQDLAAKSLVVREHGQKRKADMQRCLERYHNFMQSKEKIRANLHHMEKSLWKALLHNPVSYKEALELSEQSKLLVSRLVSAEEDLMKLRQDSGHLSLMCREKETTLITAIVSTLWLKWLHLLEAAKEWESKCEEQNQEWKSVSEDMERETIILDNLQEELPENPKERESVTKEELQEFLECASCYEESVEAEKLLLHLILHRIRDILRVPGCPSEKSGGLPIVNEIQAMQDRLKELHEKVQKQKDAVLSEIQDQAKAGDEINAVKNSLQTAMSLLQNLDSDAVAEKAAKLEEIQRAIDDQKQALEQIMDKLRINYSEMYTIVPVEIETHLEDCKQTLQDLEEKVNTEVQKNSPHYATDKKIEDINKGLQAIESMLQQKSENITKAKEVQKRIWDLLDLWHYKMNELDAEVQDMAEQDPCQVQELMDRLMFPLQQYQQVSQRAERRTANLNRAASRMEEYEELLKSTQVWLENTSHLLTEELKSDSSKALNKHASALQMALEDAEQKQNILRTMHPELEEMSTLIETDSMVQELNKVNGQVSALQQKIIDILPHIQHLADEVEAIECEVKTMEKDVGKIKTILSPSEDTLDFSPRDHLKHGQVVLAHINPMQKTLAEIQSYKESLRLPGMKIQPFSVFHRTKQLLKELKMLERITKEQNKLLEPIVKEVEESEQEIDSLRQFLKSHSDELSTGIPLSAQGGSYPEEEEVEKIKQQIAILCQRKEDVLATMKNSMLELHQRQEESDPEDETVELQVPEESRGGTDWQLKKRGSLSLLPSLVEETEDSSFHSEVDASEPKAAGDKHDQQLSSLSSEGARSDDGESLGDQTVAELSTPFTSTAECFRRTRGDSKEAGRPGPEPARVLHACQAQVSKLELWLDQAKESLGSKAQTRQMQQMVEQHLAACQVMLSEIEQKVLSLLEDCKERHTNDSPGLQQEAENLSLKLKDVKCNLEKVQGMLQDKYMEEQPSSEKSPEILPFDLSSVFPLATSDSPQFSRLNGLEQQQELLTKLSEQSNLLDFIEMYVDEVQPQSGENPILGSQASHQTPSSGNEPRALIPKDRTGDKWQFLQEELLFKMNPPHCQFAEAPMATRINILPKGATSNVRTPTVEELKMYTAQLGSLSQEASVQTQENETGAVPLSLDQKLLELLLAISGCLSNMEQMWNPCVLTSEEAPVQQVLCETLSVELQKLHADIGNKKDDLLKSITSAGGDTDRFSQCFSSLQAWLQMTEAAAASRSKSVKAELNHYSNYQNEIRQLYDALIEKKSTLQQSFNAMSGHGISKQLQKIQACELELKHFETQAAKLRDHGERLHLPVTLIHEAYKLEDVLDDLWGILRAKQRELISPSISEHQYEALLHGLSQLAELGQEKIAQVPNLKATSRTNLEFHLKNHKSFFRTLHTHMLLVQMCSKKVPPALLQKRETFWNELVEKMKSLEQQAVHCGTRLERLLQDWIEFDKAYLSFSQKLEALSSTVPSVSLVEETEERLMERTRLLQQIKRSTEGEQARYHQILKEGKNLVASVSCPELQNQVEKLEEQWASLCKKVDHELQRLETLLKFLSSYNRDSKELEKWLESAQQRVNDWKEHSLNASQDLNTVRDNIHNLLAFSKEVDDQSSLKSSVISTGNQLLLLKESDTAMLRSLLTEFEQKWADLIAQIPGIQEKFHQLQMAKLPSHEAIMEITAWMNHIDQQRRNEATADLQSPACQVKGLLKKYREYLMEMNFKQWIVDYVNQSLLQTSTCDVESKRYERTAFAERLGEMNLQWHSLQGSLNSKIKELEHLLESVTEKENRAQALGCWLEGQSKRLTLAEKPASFILAQSRAEDCKVLENQLAVKSADVDQLKQNYMALGDHAKRPEERVKGIHKLDEMRTRVANQLEQLKTSAQTALEEWRVYDEAQDEVKLLLARASYSMEHSKPPVTTAETMNSQVENLQSLQDKAESNEESLARLQAAAGNLKKLCDPSCSEIIDQKCKEACTRWMQLNEEIGDQLQKVQTSLSLWDSYIGLHADVTAKLDKHEEQCNSLLEASIPAGLTMEFLKQKIQDVKKLQLGLENIKGSFLQASELADKIAQLAEPATQSLLPDKLHPLQRITYLEKMLQTKENEFQSGLVQLEDFENCLERLENDVKASIEVLDNLNQGDEDTDLVMSQMMGLTALAPEMESLNEDSFKLPLSDFTAKRLQGLNWQWTQKTAMALEQCRELQGLQSDEKKFLQRCQNWVQFLEKMKEGLKEKVPGTLEKLREQQRGYEMLQADISVNQQIFNSIVSKALHMLESGEAENRTEFISKLSLLKEQWQSVVWMVQQRKREIDGLAKQWQKFTTSTQDLTKFVTDINSFVAAVKSQEKYSLHQARSLSHNLKNKEIVLQRWQTRYSLTLETGEKLLGLVAPEAKTAIQMEMSQLQENWENTQLQAEKITKQFQDTLQTWGNCERQVGELDRRLQELKARIEDPLPAEDDELQTAKEHIKELEKSLANWNHNVKELGIMKADLAHYILAEDVMVLKEQVEHLHRQWEELCLRVSLRKQEIEDRLNAWIVFNEKNKELCAWLVQMESKVLQSADVSIEDMIDKLQKDCMEEINLFSENKLVHLKQMGDQLIKASSKSRVAEIDEKLNKINDRWQHLFDVIGGRVKKLKETFAFIQQLDKNMSNLRTWLARIESELSKPVVYDICDDQEIQKRLAEQQDLQRDIDQHSTGVESVFNICEVLLHDSDACANETECDSIQQTTRSLDRRWRNICTMSMERRMKIEETWRLWQKFLDDYSRFEDWLKMAEKTAAYPNSSEVSYTNAKEELKKFEAFQRQIHERLTQLELINKQYRRLARENRTDSASKLKLMVHEGNQRWDSLQKRVAAILRRLKHFTNQWEEFVATKDSILVWLTEMDLQLTNVEHFSESNFDDKMRQLNGFQQEITLNTNKIDQLTEFGEHLIQKSEPSDAVVIEEELEELCKYCQEVFGRVSRFYQRLISWHPGLEDEKETSENEAETEDARGIRNDPWHRKAMQEVPPSQQSLCHLVPPTVGHERSGCETPVSIDSIPLEWDHTGDVGGSSSHEDEEEEPYYSALSDVEIIENPEAYLNMTTKVLKAASGKSVSESHTWHSPDSTTCRKHPYNQGVVVRNVLSSSPDTSTPYKPGYVKQLSNESAGSMQELSRILPGKEPQESQSLVGVASTEKQPGLERWELLQAQDLSNKLRMKQNWQQWRQLNSDLTNVSAWLDKMEEELEELQDAEPATGIPAIEQRVKKLKEMLKAFDNYKALVLSVNLTSKDFKQADSTESKELQNRLRRVNLCWEKANLLMGNWRKSLQEDLMRCQDFHELNQKLLLWLAGAETRRHQAQIKDPNADPLTIQESRRELMQLEKELLEQQLQVNTLQEISAYLLVRSDGGDYMEADEKVHVIGEKLKQLLERVSHDLKVSRGNQDLSAFLTDVDELDAGRNQQLSEKPCIYQNKADGRKALESQSGSNTRLEDGEEASPAAPKTPSFFYRVLRVALPLQLLFLLLLLLASMIPFSEEDYSCTQTNNFARSFYPMLRYINGPPPT